MSIKRLHMKQIYPNGDYWNTAEDHKQELICRNGLRDYCDVPANAKEVWACISDKQPRHNQWFRFYHDRGFTGTIIDFDDDEQGPIEMDYDFENWLRRSPPAFKYLWFEY